MHRHLSSFFVTPLLAIVVLAGESGCPGRRATFDQQREAMVREQLERRGIADHKILNAFRDVPREEFVLPRHRGHAYDDVEAPVGFGQSLDRPYENAVMIQALGLGARDRVLEIGTGIGYLTAVMSRIAPEVYTIEIEPDIAEAARRTLARTGFANIKVKTGDGFLGWPEHAPFDAIIMGCSPDRVPEPLAEQLAEGGRLLLPLGGTEKFQELVLYTKRNGKLIETRRIAPTTFSPMKGKILER